MTQEQIAALQALIGRALTEGEVVIIEPLVDARDDAGVALALSAGRVRLEARLLTERGVLSALGAEAGDEFLSSLEAIKAPEDLPAPLQSKFGAIRRAVGWLGKDGIDVADPLTRGLLDALAATGVIQVSSAATIKKLAERPDPISVQAVTSALGCASLSQHGGISVGDTVRVLAPFDSSFPGPRKVDAIVSTDDGIRFRITGGWELMLEQLELVQ